MADLSVGLATVSVLSKSRVCFFVLSLNLFGWFRNSTFKIGFSRVDMWVTLICCVHAQNYIYILRKVFFIIIINTLD